MVEHAPANAIRPLADYHVGPGIWGYGLEAHADPGNQNPSRIFPASSVVTGAPAAIMLLAPLEKFPRKLRSRSDAGRQPVHVVHLCPHTQAGSSD